jgi:hypothetical protein
VKLGCNGANSLATSDYDVATEISDIYWHVYLICDVSSVHMHVGHILRTSYEVRQISFVSTDVAERHGRAGYPILDLSR